jgi:hypothetical protein
MDTFGKLHALPTRQLELEGHVTPKDYQSMSLIHPDTKSLSVEDVAYFSQADFLYKQHIVPTDENVQKLKALKKVVLLRNPYDIILAYRRGTLKGIHGKKIDFDKSESEGEWLEKADKSGLLLELKNFESAWRDAADEHTLLIEYQELMKEPQKNINRIEQFWNLPITSKPIKLSKKRYSHHSPIKQTIAKTRKQGMRWIIKHGYYERAKRFHNYLRANGVKWI